MALATPQLEAQFLGKICTGKMCSLNREVTNPHFYECIQGTEKKIF